MWRRKPHNGFTGITAINETRARPNMAGPVVNYERERQRHPDSEPEKLPLNPFISKDYKRTDYVQYVKNLDVSITAVIEVLSTQIE